MARRHGVGAKRGAKRLVAASALLALACSGCALFTDLNVDGYTPLDAGACVDDGGCAALLLSLSCHSDSSCDAGQICCLGVASLSLSPVSASATCQEGPSCTATSLQLCKASSECHGGASCTPCPLARTGATVSACGTSPVCSP